jgi:hypothetical protein
MWALQSRTVQTWIHLRTRTRKALSLKERNWATEVKVWTWTTKLSKLNKEISKFHPRCQMLTKSYGVWLKNNQEDLMWCWRLRNNSNSKMKKVKCSQVHQLKIWTTTMRLTTGITMCLKVHTVKVFIRSSIASHLWILLSRKMKLLKVKFGVDKLRLWTKIENQNKWL